MKVDPRMVQPFNEWWRKSNHCEPSQQAVEAFAAGFKAGLKCGVDGAMAVLNSSPVSATGDGC